MADKPPEQPKGKGVLLGQWKNGVVVNEIDEPNPTISLRMFFSILELRMRMACEDVQRLDAELAKRNSRGGGDSSKDKEPGPDPPST